MFVRLYFSETAKDSAPAAPSDGAVGRVRRHHYPDAFADDSTVDDFGSYRDNGWWHPDYPYRPFGQTWNAGRNPHTPSWYCLGRFYYGVRPSFCSEGMQFYNNYWNPFYQYEGAPTTCQYQFENGPLPWKAAAAHCSRQGMTLAVLSTKVMQNYALTAFGDKPAYWIGAANFDRNHIFTWISGQPLYGAPWAHGEPNNPGLQNCVHANYDGVGGWDDAYCEEAKPFLCQRC